MVFDTPEIAKSVLDQTQGASVGDGFSLDVSIADSAKSVYAEQILMRKAERSSIYFGKILRF